MRQSAHRSFPDALRSPVRFESDARVPGARLLTRLVREDVGLRPFRCWAVMLALFSLSTVFTVMAAAPANSPRLELSADSNWRFLLGDPSGAEARSYDDTSWRKVDLPHDWSIEGKPAKDNPTGSGGGFYPAGTGWYRRSFRAPAEWKGQRVHVVFDGVYRDATVYLNGHKLGNQPYGYTSFRFDLTPDLDFTQPNVLAVRVDNSKQPNSRWYSGSGIYRHVRVVVIHPAHVADWGVFVTTKAVAGDRATLAVRTRVANEGSALTGFTVETRILDRNGKPAGSAKSSLEVPVSGAAEANQEVVVARARLWSMEDPTLYRVVTRVLQSGTVVDEVETPFGIRTITWSVEKGLLLNGKPIKLAGGSVHHDNGPLGAMAFDRAEERRVQILKAAGFNAVRTSHNPPSPAFLDACDRLGLLVFDEAFDTWKANKAKFDYGRDFEEWWQRDLSAMVLRDRNHPSVIFWSIGNEIPEVLVERGPGLAKKLAAQVRSLDSSRPVSQAFPTSTSGEYPDAVIANLDVTGYNYNLAAHHEEDHRRLPGRLMMTTESFPGAAFTEWRLSKDNPYILGEFVWTAMDYLGESGIGSWSYGSPQLAAMASKAMSGMQSMVDKMFLAMANGMDMSALMTQGAAQGGESPLSTLFPGFPWHAAQCGDIDLTGYRKPQSYYRDILWNGGDRVYATVRLPEPEGKKTVVAGWAVFPTMPSWTWPGQEGKTLQVEVYSGVEKVRLYLNGQLIGEKPAGREQEFKAMFDVPYSAGQLRAVGVRGDRVVAESVLTTTGRPARLKLSADRAAVQADGQDLSFVTVEAVDAEGRLQTSADQEAEFAVEGPGLIAAVGNADGRDSESYQGSRRRLYQGRALVVIRSSKQGGAIRLRATAPGLTEASVTIQAKGGKQAPAELQ